MKEFWIQVLAKMEPRVKRAHFVTWFQDTAVLSKKDGLLIIGVPNVYARDWLENKLNGELISAVREVDSAILQISFEVHPNLGLADDKRGVDVKTLVDGGHSPRKVRGKQEVRLAEGVVSKCLNPKYTLQNFVVGQDNRLAHAACMAVSASPGSSYNPLFVYGGVGLGKTHLLQATGNEILRNYSDKVVVYMTSERFTNEIVEAIGKRSSKSFKDRYRNVDCLIIDDIQFLANKEMTQVEFFHTFNELYDNGKQIIISSDKPPKELKGLEQRLTSRFEMGMIVDVQFPDFETRLAILHAKCREHQVLIAPEVLEFVAYNVRNSVRELEGVLLQAIAQSQLEQSTPTIRSVARIVKKLNKIDPLAGYDEKGDDRTVARSPDDVLSIVCKYYKIERDYLVGADRHIGIMRPRQIAMYLIKQELRHSYEEIGRLFSGRNHTTVMHAVDKVLKTLRKDEGLLRDVNALKMEMGM
ncbi:MAG: Chromosomal replication initiator protein chromosomal replication initiator protein [Candidatus Peregrinibacteria bacterium GW2011_GWF2_43_17]|nr:MAG: Chromosomal replication initiator protein chromosomal replication initiator protein [Candidatus Peregrinibacteria bacterium GW2011_GWF2_43_17]KKT18896.1 MAG: Chromosomal replication initiator protein DnaA [Candidatus Peregrinibacteria bacterium GW2011_GWA2_43_8]HAU39490.1 chromosomal replication initiator protein DnaA [Candidatus Peregrinibacteria bacterium]